jgi:hypothetical protein
MYTAIILDPKDYQGRLLSDLYIWLSVDSRQLSGPLMLHMRTMYIYFPFWESNHARTPDLSKSTL